MTNDEERYVGMVSPVLLSDGAVTCARYHRAGRASEMSDHWRELRNFRLTVGAHDPGITAHARTLPYPQQRHNLREFSYQIREYLC